MTMKSTLNKIAQIAGYTTGVAGLCIWEEGRRKKLAAELEAKNPGHKAVWQVKSPIIPGLEYNELVLKPKQEAPSSNTTSLRR